jgi:hypothetical protein
LADCCVESGDIKTAAKCNGSVVAEYLQVIREHVMLPLQSAGVSESCFASAILEQAFLCSAHALDSGQTVA